MAREYVRIRISISDDEEFEELIPEAQWLYLRVLLPEPSLNYAGVGDWRPNRLVGKAKGIDLTYILRGAADLEERRYALFDVATEEVLVRTFIRNDELLRNPKMAPAVVKGYQSTASKMLKSAVLAEIAKAHDEHPEYTSWAHKDTAADLSRLLIKSGSESVPYTNQIVVPITNPVPGADYQSDSVPIPSLPSPTTYHQAPDTPREREPAPHEHLPARTNNGGLTPRQLAAELNKTERSITAYKIAEAFSASSPIPIQRNLLAGIGTQIDACLRDGIPPPAIANGLKAWTDSDSFSPTQIPNYVHKANNGSRNRGVGKPTEKALGYDAALTELLQEVETL